MKKSNIELYNDSLTSAERIENARKSGIASGKARREGRLMRESLLGALESENAMDKICKVLIEKALAGDVSAIRLLRDTIGELPTLAINLEQMHKEVVLIAMNKDQLDAIDQVQRWLPEITFTVHYLADDDGPDGLDPASNEIVSCETE